MTATPESLNLSYLRQLVGNLSGLVHIRSREIFKNRLSERSLTPKQAVVLEFIANNPGVSQRAIAQGVVTTPAMLVSVLDTLTAQGLVERVPDRADRRRTCVQLTAGGQVALEDIKRSFLRVEEVLQAESGMTDAEWQMLISLLRKITEQDAPPAG